MTLTVNDPAPLDTDRAGAVLEVDDLTVDFVSKRSSVHVVRGVTFTVNAGETLVLLGESGSGKSVTARSLLRLHGARARIGGRVRLRGRDLLALSDRDMGAIRGRGIGMVPQDPTASLDPLRRIGAQLGEVLRAHGMVTGRRAAAARAGELLRQVGIADPRRVAHGYPHELSGGMRQRAVIAMAVACEPTILVADEPTTALDVTVQAQVLDLFAELQAGTSMGLLMVTHDVGVARQVADRVAVMYAGRIVEEGPAGAVLDHPGHPYTRALLAAVPTPEIGRGDLAAIPGRPPAPREVRPHACAFAARCPLAGDECLEQLPRAVPLGPGHAAACLRTEATTPAVAR